MASGTEGEGTQRVVLPGATGAQVSRVRVRGRGRRGMAPAARDWARWRARPRPHTDGQGLLPEQTGLAAEVAAELIGQRSRHNAGGVHGHQRPVVRGDPVCDVLAVAGVDNRVHLGLGQEAAVAGRGRVRDGAGGPLHAFPGTSTSPKGAPSLVRHVRPARRRRRPSCEGQIPRGSAPPRAPGPGPQAA